MMQESARQPPKCLWGDKLTRRKDRGFSILEMLAVMVVLGILAVIALAKYTSIRDKGYLTTLKADLKNVAIHQEIYYYDQGNFNYSNDLTALQFFTSPGVTIAIPEATNTGWSGRATHVASTWSCALFIGDAEDLEPATEPGVIDCAKP